jgi:anti-sigma factor RsiW
MEHIPIEIICRMADNDIAGAEMHRYAAHMAECRKCRQEVALQQSIMRVARSRNLPQPSAGFTDNILKAIAPSGAKRWYEQLLNNMGNMIAVAAVLVFLAFVFSSTSTMFGSSARATPENEIVKSAREGIDAFSALVLAKLHSPVWSSPFARSLAMVMVGVAFLVLIDRLAQRVFPGTRVSKM